MKNIFDDSCDPVRILTEPLSHLAIISTTESGLKSSLSKLESYCTLWQLEVNIKKSKVVIFNRSGRIISGQNFTFHSKPLDLVKSYCYLGIDMPCSGPFQLSRTNLIDKAQKALYPLTPLLSTIAQFKLPSSKTIKLFESMIRPIALYNSENLTHFTQHQIESLKGNKVTLLSYMNNTSYTSKLHQSFLKYILGVKRNCSNLATLGELGELPLHAHAIISLLSFWHRTSQMPENSLARQALNSRSPDDASYSEWFTTVKFLMNHLGMASHLQNPKPLTPEKLKSLCMTN